MLKTILNIDGVTVLKKHSQKEITAGRWNGVCPSEGSPCVYSSLVYILQVY
ncbi:hypothetical protein U6A24_17890 [Aquimarina gracilis]|uniref:Uncharacterized protein n=1 Tax=Aquimarina gracilis TaxID=874422 RepID=A0ABU5ZZM3_9FLAO|nr:hypothetical protein [Aquimarina gracilis]MEB3347352.1 hypothetical protein [Aquimarina gracilis]